jgi:hypothetical protein
MTNYQQDLLKYGCFLAVFFIRPAINSRISTAYTNGGDWHT